ncbi:indolepyruvate ferredoxin oxidoreductase subunit alpha [Alteribacillus iranensis]|uniref:Ferredoxin n=1 Tax=Alteribacillus iranensis TaxID=930128 RepID=A0A1I2F2A2_9BACI|nr:4Fe-4S binding protein [Alteribacillus iranensis]SFE98651.1 4Fe-4S binding domain-containing protein [Alteribacillus iranensis]
MAFVITSACQNEKSADCVSVCPVDCIEEGENMYYIDPDSCIGCGACMEVCPVEAIYEEDEIPESEKKYIEINQSFFN